jgi:RHS repeat-associated protein
MLMIPWANFSAFFQDGSKSCDNGGKPSRHLAWGIMLKRHFAISLMLAIVLATPALAAEQRFSLLIDSDHNSNTGCQVATANGPAAGIEQVLTTVLSTTATTVTVARVELQVCNGGTLSVPSIIDNGGWPVGLGLGTSGLAVIETAVPLSSLNPNNGTLRVLATSRNATGGADATEALSVSVSSPHAVPFSPWMLALMASALLFVGVRCLRRTAAVRLICLILVVQIGVGPVWYGTGIAWAARVILDGNPAEWAGIAPAITDPQGDAPINADIVAVFYQSDQNSLYFRIDADVRRDQPVNQAPVVNAGSNQAVTLPASAALNGSATDDGLPNPPGALTYTWSKVSGPGTVAFGNQNSPTTTANFSVAGTYVLRLTAFDGALPGISDVTIVVSDSTLQIAAVADRTIEFGSRFQQVLQASSSNGNAGLSYALLAAPTGAALNPAPLVDWMPTAAQIGPHSFTAQVDDGQGHTAATSFQVTVAHTNQPPQLQPQANATIDIGTTFSRTLVASDPDDGDVLTFSLVSGPTGMTLTGAAISWPTTGKAIGDYTVAVEVTDVGGLSDTKQFTVTLRVAVAPVARDDQYRVLLGQTLNVAAPGVLLNDSSPGDSRALTAHQLTSPDKGALNAFGADGSFNYTAPPTLPAPPVLDAKVKWNAGPNSGNAHSLLVGDIDGDGNTDVFIAYNSNRFTARKGDGTLLFDFTTGLLPIAGLTCRADVFYGEGALADLDEDGKAEMILPVHCEEDDYGWPNPYSIGASNRVAAVSYDPIAPGGIKMKWVSPTVTAQAQRPDGSLYSPVNRTTNYVHFTVARLGPGEPPSVLWGMDFPSNGGTCADVVPGKTDAYCRVVTVHSGIDGSISQRFYYTPPLQAYPGPRYWGLNSQQSMGGSGSPVVADLMGTGQPSILFNGTVWDRAGNVRLELDGTNAPSTANDSVVVDLDGDGKPDFLTLNNAFNNYDSALRAYRADGVLLWTLPVPLAHMPGRMSVADVDRDGRPDILFFSDNQLWCVDHTGHIKWIHVFDTYGIWHVNPGTITRTPVYDLNGNGLQKVVVQYGNNDLIFLRGDNGQVELSWRIPGDAFGQESASQEPVVADLDGDGHAEIVFLHSGSAHAPNSVVVIEGDTVPWRAAPKWFNQRPFSGSNINADGSIPLQPITYWTNPATNVFEQPPPEPYVVDPSLTTQTSFTYAANNGGPDSAPATVTIDLIPVNQPPVVTSRLPASVNVVGMSFSSPFTYQITAYDPDPGDTISFAVSYRGCGSDTIVTVSPTGLFSYKDYWQPSGFCMYIVDVADNHGAVTQHTFTIFFTDPSQNKTVPNLVGMAEGAAPGLLAAVNLQVGVVTQIYNSAAPGKILSQNPAAGTSVLMESTVDYIVSLGPEPVPLPNLVGRTLADAMTQLTGLGFTVSITPVSSTTVPASEVMGQTPAFGTIVTPTPANPVTLTVSVGPPLSGTVAQVIVEPAPSATRLTGETLAYRATAVFTDGTSTDVTIRSVWNSSTPAVASVDGTGVAVALTVGTTTISATAGGVMGQAILTVVAHVADGVNPVAAITAPTDGASVTGPVSVTGTATDANFLRYELAYAPAGDANWTVFAEGTSPVTAGTLGTFDPTTLINDLYTLRLAVFDRNGNETDATVTVQVQGNAKPGLFTLTYQDLGIPMSGLPITVTRTYDSRDKAQGDFGVGWRQGFNTLRLRTNRVPGTGWVRTLGAFAVVSLAPTSEHKVSITLPDGKIEEFDLVLSPTSGFGGLHMTAVVGYAPRPGTTGSLALLNNPNLLIVNGGAEDELVNDITFDTFNPAYYRYTTPDETKIELGPKTGVTRITDRNGNNVTFGWTGIIHSSGKSVTFARDGQGRITQITDPAGNVQTYAYDGNGDLVSRSSATGDVSSYRYDRRHNLIDIQDPAGNHAARNTYDASGHLISTTDANGNTITYTHNVGASTELITDRMGNATLYAYDAMGNILAKTDPLGHVITYTYDNRNNQLTQTDPLGRVSSKTYDSKNNVLTRTDFDGNTATYTYNAFGQVLTQLDPEGNTTTNVYDGSGNLTQTTDPEGGITVYTYDGMGNLLTITDAIGKVTTFVYDVAGHQISRTDPLGNTTTYTYDSNGNRLSETDLAGKTVRFAYDANGRVVDSTDKLGNVTATVYSNIGLGSKISSRIDAMGNATSFTYDTVGNLTKTTYADGSVSSATYDVENSKLSATDPDGRTTHYEYDVLGRLTRTTVPGGAAQLVTYDIAGRVLAKTDPRGNTTTFAYATNQQTVTDALGNVTVNVFDSQGRPIKTTDALGHATSFTYDSLSNPLRTTYPDGTLKVTSYDGIKNPVTETDQAGGTTQFAYDAAGHLIRVTNALGGITSYAYDALGNRLTQTDANGHSTHMSYDALGRIATRTPPSGKQESFVYDAVGNQVSHTDFNGQTTTYGYDTQKRLTQKHPPDGTTVSYAYTAAGLRTQAGGDSYSYDAAGRLSREQKVSGETLTYAYDAAGNRTSITTPYGTTTYTFDALNPLKTVVDAAGTTTYTYDAAGRRTSTAYPNGVTTTYSYDTLNRLLQVTNTGPGGLISSYTYTLGPTGNRTQVVETGSATQGRTVTYAYDTSYRLTQEQITAPGPSTETISYTLDAVGNRTQMNHNGVTTTYVYDSSDRLIAETSGGNTITYLYDDNGNRIGGSNGGVTITYGFDAQNRLVAAIGPSGSVSYAYDADGIRTGKTTGGVTTGFLTDKAMLVTPCHSCASSARRSLARVVAEEAGSTAITYSYGHALIDRMQAGLASFYLSDGQQSTRQLVNSSGAVTDSYTFDAFGVTTAATGTTGNSFLYAGEEFDPATGFYYLRARYYDQGVGNFLSTDPENGDVFDPVSLHPYLYAKGDPVNWHDPSGGEPESLPELQIASTEAVSLDAGSGATAMGAKHATQSVKVAVDGIALYERVRVPLEAFWQATLRGGGANRAMVQKFGIKLYKAVGPRVMCLALKTLVASLPRLYACGYLTASVAGGYVSGWEVGGDILPVDPGAFIKNVAIPTMIGQLQYLIASFQCP